MCLPCPCFYSNVFVPVTLWNYAVFLRLLWPPSALVIWKSLALLLPYLLGVFDDRGFPSFYFLFLISKMESITSYFLL